MTPTIEADIGLERRAYDEPDVAAAQLLAFLEANGALLHITAHGDLRADLDPMRDLNHDKADVLARAILALGPEIKAMLRARNVLH
jgi:hypothetical protein